MWRCAVELFEEMRECELKPDVISFSSGLSACEKGGVWRCAVELLEERGDDADDVAEDGDGAHLGDDDEPPLARVRRRL